MARKSKKQTCRWYDVYCGACRNFDTHPNAIKHPIYGVIFVEPTCHYCKECGYEKIDKTHPVWDAGNDEFGSEAE